MEYVLRTEGLTKTYSKVNVVDKVSLTVKQGEIYGFVGKNGAGKTTFMRTVLGLTKASGGTELRSLGRVQTPTLALVCRRFLENRDFVPSPFWTLQVRASLGREGFTAVSARYTDLSSATADRERVEAGGHLNVKSVERKTASVQPPLLHDLTSLQREANKRYSMTAQETLSAAQALYEKKLITYPRTGSRYLTRSGRLYFDSTTSTLHYYKVGGGAAASPSCTVSDASCAGAAASLFCASVSGAASCAPSFRAFTDA